MMSGATSVKIVKRGGQYYQVFKAQGGSKLVFSPAGRTLREARQLMKESTSVNRNTWSIFEEHPFDEAEIWRQAKAFRSADTAAFKAGKKIAMVTDTPERFLPLKDGGLNPTAAVISKNGFDFEMISTADMKNGKLMDYDVAVFPGGFGYFPDQKTSGQIRRFVREGGGFIGICAGSFLPLRPCQGVKGAGLGLLDAHYEYFREKGLTLVILDQRDPLCKGMTSSSPVPVYALYKKLPQAKRYSIYITMFRMNGALMVPRSRQARAVGYYDGTNPYAAVLRGEYGKGRIVVFSAHPDATVGVLARYTSSGNAVENLKLFKNAVLYAGG